MSRAALRLAVFVCLYSCVASCFNKKHVPEPPTDPYNPPSQGGGGVTMPYGPTTTTEQSLQIDCPSDYTGYCLNGGTCRFIVKELSRPSDGTAFCLCSKGYTGFRCKYHVIVPSGISQPISVEKTAGLAVGGLLLFIMIAVVLIVIFIRQRRKRAAADSSGGLRSEMDVKEQPFHSKDFMRNESQGIPLDTAGKHPPPAGFMM